MTNNKKYYPWIVVALMYGIRSLSGGSHLLTSENGQHDRQVKPVRFPKVLTFPANVIIFGNPIL